MSKLKNGSVDNTKTVKAGCGIRYDPEQMDESYGFDFSKAENMKPENEKTDLHTKEEQTKGKPR